MKTIVRLILLVILVTVISFPFRETTQAAQTRGQSRGYLTTPAELLEIKRKADQGIQPYANAVKDVMNYANQTWSFPFLATEDCPGPDYPTWLDNNGGVPILYAKALTYNMTGDEKYAAQVKTILESIMTNVKAISLSEQRCRLVFGWGTPELVASADLIESYWSGMTCTGPLGTINGQNTIGSGNCKKLFQNWLIKNPYYVVSYAAEQSQSNWGAAATNAVAYMADYLWDRTDVMLIHRLPPELGGGTISLTPAQAYARANKLAIDRMNGYRVDYHSSEACDYLSGTQQSSSWPMVKSQISEKGIVPEDARRDEKCNIPSYDGVYHNYPQIHLSNNIQQCELMLRRGSSACFDNIDKTDIPNYSFLASDGKTKTTHLYPGRGSIERAINAIIIDSGTEWRHDSGLEVAYRYYSAHGKLGKTDAWFKQLGRPTSCSQDVCFGTLTHGFAPNEQPTAPTPTPTATTSTPTPTATTPAPTATTPAPTATTPAPTATTPAPTTTSVPGGSQQTIAPVEDTMVKLTYPTSNYGAQDNLRVRNALPTEQINTYLKFAVPDVGTIASAKLRLYAYDGGDKGGSIYAVANTYRGATTAWTEEGLIWNNAPAVGTTPLSSVGNVNASTWVEFDVTNAITGKGTYSFAIANTSTNSVFFNSKENAANQPQLLLTTGSGTPATTATTPAPTATTPAPTATTAPAATTAPGGAQTLGPSEDTMVKLAYPTSNYGAADNLRIRNTLPTDRINTYLKFVVPDVGTVSSAKIRLWVYDGGDQGGSIYHVANTYRGTTTAWTEEGLNWNTRPETGTTPLSSVGAVSANTWVEFDVTAAITGQGTYSFAILNTSTNSVFFNSKENTANQPQLVINGGAATMSALFAAESIAPAVEADVAIAAESVEDTGVEIVTDVPAETPVAIETEQPTETPVEIVTDVPAETPVPVVTETEVPALTPVPPQSLVVIESDNPAVRQDGVWTAHSTELASGGQYIYSSGSPDEALTMQFQGTQLKVVFVKHPALGILGIDIDGVQVQVVDTTAADAEFGAEVTVSGLSPDVHTVRLYPVSGTIALDAFAVESVVNEPPVVVEETPEPGDTVVPATPLPTDAPTEEPVIEPTAEPTEEPAVVDVPMVGLESDDVRVQQTGSWTAHDTAQASGGRYLYSSGNLDDILSLSFSGPRLDVIYVQHPSLGSFVVEIDGSALQTIDSMAADSVFGARMSFSLPDGVHTVRIYPASGTIAIDAFGVPAGQEPVQPPVEVTVEPPADATILPPVEVTLEPTVEPVTPIPTELPATPAPTVVPSGPDGTLPVLPLPLMDGADNAANWQMKGAWKIGPNAGMDGNGWVAHANQGENSGLKSQFLVDLTTAQQPSLRFWQRMDLSGGDSTSVDISVDGGQNWQTLDQQPGQQVEWSERVLDLSAYKGQMIRLRFRLQAGGEHGKDGDKNAWWLDNLSIQ